LSQPVARRRLRHRGFLLDQPGLRDGRRLQAVRRSGPSARHARDRRPGHEPHELRPPVVSGEPRRPERPVRRLVRVGRGRHALERGADHLPRHGALELDLGPDSRAVLLASLLRAPARPELRQPRGAGADAERAALLARPRAGRLPARRRAVPLRARRDERREPAGDARVPEARARRGRRAVPGPGPARGSEPVARRRRRVLRRRRRVSHGVPLPGDAAHVHGDAAGGRAADGRDPRTDAGDPRRRAVGSLPAQPRRADARDGHRRRARLHVRGVREGPADEAQPRHPPPARAAARQRPRRDPAHARDPLLAAGLARPLLRRRDRDGGQHLPRRPRRRAHTHAVDGRPQRRLLAGGFPAALPAAADGSGLRLPGGERRGAAPPAELAPALAAPPDCPAQGSSGLRARNLRGATPGKPTDLRPCAHLRGRHCAVRAQPRPVGAGGRARPLALGRHDPGGDVRPNAVPADRGAVLSAHARPPRVLLVPVAEGRSGMNEQALIDFVTNQRWFGSKTREVAHADIVDTAVLRDTDPTLELQLVEIRFDTGTHETYQLLADGGYDALGDPRQVRELVHLMRSGAMLPAGDGVVEFGSVQGRTGAGELREARVVTAEQSNTSIVFDDELILKVFRRLEAGINPELELLRFLTERGFANIAQLAGWYAYAGKQMTATLGILQQFVADGQDGWERALDAVESGDEAFVDSLRRLGEVTGKMHSILGSDPSDPNFCPEATSAESLGLLTATVDEEIETIFMDLPDDAEALDPIRGRGEEVRARLRLLTNIGGAGRVIRNPGDFHLGQTIWRGNDWVILDFEGEPARSLPERRRKRSPLRDVAGM